MQVRMQLCVVLESDESLGATRLRRKLRMGLPLCNTQLTYICETMIDPLWLVQSG